MNTTGLHNVDVELKGTLSWNNDNIGYWLGRKLGREVAVVLFDRVEEPGDVDHVAQLREALPLVGHEVVETPSLLVQGAEIGLRAEIRRFGDQDRGLLREDERGRDGGQRGEVRLR